MGTEDGPSSASFHPQIPNRLSSSPVLMLLVQKQPSLTLSPLQSTYHHRRHPSAPPTVVVHPTRTPGLLSLSRPQLQRYQPQQRTPRIPVSAKGTSTTVAATPTSPLPAPRGRQAKDKAVATPRSDSRSVHRHPHRQPSPSQAEGPSAPSKLQSSTNSDPFLVSVSSPPTISTRPSGKLARRRQQHSNSQINSTPYFPSKPTSISRPVLIPPTGKQPTTVKPLSRSVPLPRNRTRNRNPALLPPWDFPICDDMTDAGDFSDSNSFPLNHASSAPVTPRRRVNPNNHAQFKLSAFASTSVSYKHRTGGRNHRRAPSDSGMIFNMSSDESGSEGLTQADRDEEPKALPKGMTLAPNSTPQTPPAREPQPQGYFASSMFQNSPSPEELPDPLFV